MMPINFGALVKWISGDNINVNKKYTLFCVCKAFVSVELTSFNWGDGYSLFEQGCLLALRKAVFSTNVFAQFD